MRVCDAPIPNGERNKMPVFNPYIATSPRTSRRQKEDSAATAGTSKVPRVGVNKSDLEAQGIQYEWTARPLTYNEVREMPSSELRWHEQFNAVNLEKALTLHAKIREGKDIDRQWAVRRMWEGKATHEEDAKARAAGDAFAQRHPTFARTIESAEIMVEYMRQNDLNATEVSSYTKAFNALVEEGKLTPATPQSADEFLRSHVELHEKRTPPLIAARNAKAQQTKKYFEAAANVTAKGTITRLTDYPDEHQGIPPYSEIEKASLRAKVKNMSSSELADKCQNDPSFKKALDSL
jgi:hypothetical protein